MLVSKYLLGISWKKDFLNTGPSIKKKNKITGISNAYDSVENVDKKNVGMR